MVFIDKVIKDGVDFNVFTYVKSLGDIAKLRLYNDITDKYLICTPNDLMSYFYGHKRKSVCDFIGDSYVFGLAKTKSTDCFYLIRMNKQERELRKLIKIKSIHITEINNSNVSYPVLSAYLQEMPEIVIDSNREFTTIYSYINYMIVHCMMPDIVNSVFDINFIKIESPNKTIVLRYKIEIKDLAAFFAYRRLL